MGKYRNAGHPALSLNKPQLWMQQRPLAVWLIPLSSYCNMCLSHSTRRYFRSNPPLHLLQLPSVHGGPWWLLGTLHCNKQFHWLNQHAILLTDDQISNMIYKWNFILDKSIIECYQVFKTIAYLPTCSWSHSKLIIERQIINFFVACDAIYVIFLNISKKVIVGTMFCMPTRWFVKQLWNMMRYPLSWIRLCSDSLNLMYKIMGHRCPPMRVAFYSALEAPILFRVTYIVSYLPTHK